MFPWRQSSDPFVVLTSELLLRKTSRRQVADIFKNFFKKYPNFQKLSKAELRDIEATIHPLGMEHRRAPLLRTLAQRVVREYGSKIPVSRLELLDLPGVGPYAANAVLCFCSGKDEPLVDTNFIRVVERAFSYKSTKNRSRTDSELWKFARGLIPKRKGRDFNLGILDFAANICTSAKPRCSECPMTEICDYYKKQYQKSL